MSDAANPKRLTKAEREAVRAKYHGRCAYCGIELTGRWHVDHLKPVRRRAHPRPDQDQMRWPKRHALDNCMPSCAPCNIDKHARSLEQWREWLQAHLRSLQRQPNYRLVRAHGLVRETNEPVLFYFERIAYPAGPQGVSRGEGLADQGRPDEIRASLQMEVGGGGGS